jgi:hypothetical protein
MGLNVQGKRFDVLPPHGPDAALVATPLVNPSIPEPQDLFHWSFNALEITDRGQLLNAIGTLFCIISCASATSSPRLVLCLHSVPSASWWLYSGRLVEALGVADVLGVDMGALARYFSDICGRYRNNPFHNLQVPASSTRIPAPVVTAAPCPHPLPSPFFSLAIHNSTRRV